MPAKFAYRTEDNVSLDYYPTPPWAVHTLLDNENFHNNAWEPACGDGRLAEAIKSRGYNVHSTDVTDRGYGAVQNFLTATTTGYDIVTNLPFNILEDFLRRALELTHNKVALLLKLSVIEGIGRYNRVWSKTPIAKILPFSSRVQIWKNGIAVAGTSSTIPFAWFVWNKQHEGSPTLEWIPPRSQVTDLRQLELPLSKLSTPD